jgi:UDP-N-acetyl-D-galactosamine dehydrogenase
MYHFLRKKIEQKKALVSIIGLGYVGLPLLIELSKHYETIGYDKDITKINNLKRRKDIKKIVSNNHLQKIKSKFTEKIKDLRKSDVIIITLPTPVNSKNLPNLNGIYQSLKEIITINLKNKLIILESTVYPGASIEFINFLEKNTNYKINRDFYFGYTPERINPGDKKNTLRTITKIISGSNKKSLNLVKILYQRFVKKICKAKNIEHAEMAKVIENCQRDINIAFINEIALICDKLNISSYDVLNLASTKWNFLKFSPGLVGGHCIGVDPYYLAYKARKIGYKSKIILSGRNLNESITNFIAKKINNILKKKHSKILLMGLSYKKDSNDFRNSKSIDLYRKLKKKHDVKVYDPYLNQENLKKIKIDKSIKKLSKSNYDMIVISVDHTKFKKMGIDRIKKIGKKNVLIFDIKNLFPKHSNFSL